ncbi:MAG: GerMN domain-containing protein [Clostridia bacterium]|nr:GerMN domain-containing protein [Clostridia bacterium]
MGGKLLAIGLVLLLALAVGGCGRKVGVAPDNGVDISAEPAPSREKVILYFGDKEAMYLLAEERELAKGEEPLAEVIINELIKGPQQAEAVRTIPEGSKLLSLSVEEGVAYVNFSREFQTKHWGGSAGESMTVYSVVNSLAELPDIEKVQFLLEGNKEESILGHIGTASPIEPNWDLVAK